MMKKLTTWASSSLTRRTLVYISLVLTAQIFLTGIIGYRWIFSYIESIFETETRQLNQSLVQEINYIRSNYENQADRIMANQTIQEILERSYSEQAVAGMYIEERRKVESLLMDPDNKILSILLGNNIVYQSRTSNYIITSFDEISKSQVYKWALTSQGKSLWFASREEFITKRKKAVVYLCKAINYTKYDFHRLGYLIMLIPLDTLDKVFMRNHITENEYYAITDDNGQYIYHSLRKELIGEYLEDDLLFIKNAKDDIKCRIDSPSGPLTVYYSPYKSLTKKSGWNIIHAVPTSVTSAYASRIRNMILTIMFMLLLITMPLMLSLFNNITKPIVRLKNIVAAYGNTLYIRTPVNRRDEIGNLQESFNRMADDIEKLIREKEENSKRLRKLELTALEFQVNPHFLYNTLDSIRWMARKSGNKDVAEMVLSLARFYRIGLNRGQEFYCVKDELEHVRHYLMIHKIRFKDSFTFVIEADDAVLSYPVLKIILLPIVENAIKHGIDKNGCNGLIGIRASLWEDRILFEVSDNGPGIAAEQLSIIRKSLDEHELFEESENGFGLYNVSQRLRLHYGENAGITIENRKSGGTLTRLYIPVRYINDESK